jgi:hypothetical protein
MTGPVPGNIAEAAFLQNWISAHFQIRRTKTVWAPAFSLTTNCHNCGYSQLETVISL